MKRFERTDKGTGNKTPMIAAQGSLTRIDGIAVANTNGKSYHRFNAEIVTPKGPKLIAGHIYVGLLPYIGGLPTKGASLEFVSSVADLQGGYNTRWGIAGNTVDSADDILGML